MSRIHAGVVGLRTGLRDACRGLIGWRYEPPAGRCLWVAPRLYRVLDGEMRVHGSGRKSCVYPNGDCHDYDWAVPETESRGESEHGCHILRAWSRRNRWPIPSWLTVPLDITEWEHDYRLTEEHLGDAMRPADDGHHRGFRVCNTCSPTQASTRRRSRSRQVPTSVRSRICVWPLASPTEPRFGFMFPLGLRWFD